MVTRWQLRQPAHTGENRCIPCTIVNAAITVAIAVALVIATWSWGLDFVESLAVGTGMLVIGAALIALRGYLVPGTPWLTERYLPDWVLVHFDKAGHHPEPTDADLDAEALLADGGVVRPCDEEDDLCLTDAFSTAWRSAMADRRDLNASLDDLAELLGADPAELVVDSHDEAIVARRDGQRIGQWASDAAFIADMGAAAVLHERLDRWEHLDIGHRSSILHGLRAFLEVCPVCDGQLVMDERVRRSCCRSVDVVAIECRSCERPLLEVDHPGRRA